MSSLSNQLKSIKIQQNVLKIGPNQQQPSILFDKFTARTTSIDTIYSLALLSYQKLQSNFSNSIQQIHNREQILSQKYIQINRNTLTKQQNMILSKKLQKFTIQLSPFMLNSQCQHIIQYLLRNFKINIFQTQVLALSMLQYWNFQIYQKLISNINKKKMINKLSFLNQIIGTEQINLSFIIKTLTFSHALLQKLITIVLEASILQIFTAASKDHIINMNTQHHILTKHESNQYIKHSLKNFLLKIFLQIIKDKKTQHYKYIIDFCNSCLRIKHPSINYNNKQSCQLISLILTLLVNLLLQNAISDQYLNQSMKKIIKKFINYHQLNKLIFDFIMVVWQRKSNIIDKQLLISILKIPQFLSYFNQFKSSKYMIFFNIFQMICIQIETQTKEESNIHLFIQMLQLINVKIKNQQFYKLYSKQFLSKIFENYYQLEINQKSNQKIIYLRQFIKKYYKYQYAQWINYLIENNNKYQINIKEQNIQFIFNNNEINIKNNLIQLSKIQKMQIIEKKQKQFINRQKLRLYNHKNQQIDQQSEPEDSLNIGKNIATNNKKLLQYLKKKGITQYNTQNQIDYQNPQIIQKIVQLLNQYYSSSIQQNDKINLHKKNYIFQKLLSLYKIDQFPFNYDKKKVQYDLMNEQYNTIIKYLIYIGSQTQNKQKQTKKSIYLSKQYLFGFLQNIFSYILKNKKVLQSIIFRQLIRLLIKHIILPISQIQYKKIIVFLSKCYKKLITSCKDSIYQLVQINAFILKMSQKIFEYIGNNKGKYQNLMHNHCKILSLLINYISNRNSSIFDQERFVPLVCNQLISNTYHTIIKIFGNKQFYLINIGIIQLITRKQLQYKQLKYFIEEVMLKQIKYEIDTQKQSQIKINFYQHILSVGKCLIFANYMYDIKNNVSWINSIDSMITSGIAKNQISIFYGLIKDKLKKNIARKIFLFIKLTYQSKLFINQFKNYLTIIRDDNQLTTLLHLFSQIYYILLSQSKQIQDGKIVSVCQNLLDSITNLFPLQLRLTLFKPLLPNARLYNYLFQQLQIHQEVNYEQLGQLINIVPEELSLQYINFVKQCLKRGHTISFQVIQSLFLNSHFLNDQNNFQLYSQLICYIGQHDKDKLIPFINEAMNIILVFSSKMMKLNQQSKQNYCLALVYRIMISYKQLIEPFVYDIYKLVLQSQRQFVQKFIQDTVQQLTIPTLIQVVKKLSKTTQHYYNFGLFFRQVSKKGVGHLLIKTLQYYISKTIHSSLIHEVDLSNLYDLQAEIFLQMSMKFNENQLRKILIDFIRWTQIKQNQQNNLPFNMRKIIISAIFSQLSKTLGSLFTPFYGYIFDSFLKDLQEITENKKIAKNNKRQRLQTDFSDKIILVYLQYSLKSLSLLLVHDKQNQFLDGTKFDKLSQQLANLFTITKFQEKDYLKMTDKYLSDCLLKLCTYLKDDYQLKSLNLKILLLLRIKTVRIQHAIFNFMDKLIDLIQDKYLLFINDLVPFLIDNIHHRNQNIKIKIKSIINKVEYMSGTKIDNYIK